MTKRSHRAPALTGAALLLAISAPAMAAGDVTTGPSSSESPYIVPVADGVKVRSIVTVGDAVRGYRLVGIPVERAGLTGGVLYGIKVPGVATESRATALGGETAFTLASLGDVTGSTGAQLQAESVNKGVTEFLRPEDGHWDPRDPDVFSFMTTDRFDSIQDGSGAQEGNSRLWRLRFDDINDPTAGGTISMLLDGTEGPQMMDNITVDRTGHILIQEDPGNQAYLACIWSYDIADDELTVIAKADPARFSGSTPLTADEETSGIIDASRLLGRGWFLATVQAHHPIAGELVEGGQLVAIFSPDSAHRHRD